jgi:hypothetical protein
MCATMLAAVLLALSAASQPRADFDRDRCYQKCRGKPGSIVRLDVHVDGNFAQGSYDACMQECDRQFWQDFDDKSKDMDKMK